MLGQVAIYSERNLDPRDWPIIRTLGSPPRPSHRGRAPRRAAFVPSPPPHGACADGGLRPGPFLMHTGPNGPHPVEKGPLGTVYSKFLANGRAAKFSPKNLHAAYVCVSSVDGGGRDGSPR